MSSGDERSNLDESLLGIVDFPAVRRGYSPTHVQAFVKAAHTEMRRLAGENHQLRVELDELDHQLRSAPPAAALPAPVVAPAVPASPLDEWGQRTNAMLAGARADIDRMLDAARSQASDIVAQARADAAGIRNSADQEAALRISRTDDQRAKMLAAAMDEQHRAAAAADQARAELVRVERQRESIATSLRSLQSALSQAVDTISQQRTAPPTVEADRQPLFDDDRSESSVVSLHDHRGVARTAF